MLLRTGEYLAGTGVDGLEQASFTGLTEQLSGRRADLTAVGRGLRPIWVDAEMGFRAQITS